MGAVDAQINSTSFSNRHVAAEETTQRWHTTIRTKLLESTDLFALKRENYTPRRKTALRNMDLRNLNEYSENRKWRYCRNHLYSSQLQNHADERGVDSAFYPSPCGPARHPACEETIGDTVLTTERESRRHGDQRFQCGDMHRICTPSYPRTQMRRKAGSSGNASDDRTKQTCRMKLQFVSK